MPINDLPNEILGKIFKYVAHDNQFIHDQIWDLASLSRTSRRLHILTQSLLYSSFEEGHRRSLLNYLRTVLERPQLASNAKLYKGWHKHWTFSKHSVILYFSGRSVKKSFIKNAIKNILSNEQEAQDWFEAIGDGSWDATTSLALAHLPQLQHLHLAIVGVYRSPIDYQVDTQAGNYYWIRETLMRAAQLQHQGISSPPALEHLTTVTLIPNRENSRELSMWQLLPFLKLKSIQKLIARGWDLFSWDVEANIELAIVELELLNFNIRESLIRPFFACFPSLEKLRYEYFNSMGFREPRPHVMNSLSRALIQARPPLKMLCITHASTSPFSYAFGDISPRESLSPFKELEVVDVLAFDKCIHAQGPLPAGAQNPELVPLAALLPRSIKQLTLRDASKITIGHVMGLLQQRECVPDLKVINIVLGTSFEMGWGGDELVLVTEKAFRCGIEMLVEAK